MSRFCFLLMALAAGCREPAGMAIRTMALPAPALREPAFEPHLAVDPDNSDRIIVAAQYGVSRNRGGRGIWTWSTADGGRTWSSANMPLPGGERSTMAADPVTAFGADGRALLTFLFADSTSFEGGLALAQSGPDDLQLGPASAVVRDQLLGGGGAVDKGWLVVDRTSSSPLHGTTYLIWHMNRPLPNRTVESMAMITMSTDGTRTWSEAVAIGRYFGTQLGVRRDGGVDLGFVDRNGTALLHARALDGGRLISPVDTIATVSAGQTIDLPSVAVDGEAVVACWVALDADRTRLQCAAGDGEGPWSLAVVDSGLAGPAGLPAVTIAGNTVWLAHYQATADSLFVRLSRSSDGGRHFAPHATLASRPIGRARACLSPASDCRRTLASTGAYFPGDYIGIAAARDKVAVAYALPDGSDPSGRSTIEVAILKL